MQRNLKKNGKKVIAEYIRIYKIQNVCVSVLIFKCVCNARNFIFFLTSYSLYASTTKIYTTLKDIQGIQE